MAKSSDRKRRQGDRVTIQEYDISTYGLNAPSQELATLGEPIKILFGKRTEQGTGGFVHTPQLVYQRMHSAGAYEWARIGFVLAEGGVNLDKPPQQGFRIGNDLIQTKQPEFWRLNFTNGSTADNDPTALNTVTYGDYFLSGTLGPNDEFFTVQSTKSAVRGLSQSFSPGASFGLEGEPPDCETSVNPELTVLIPNPTTGTRIQYNPVSASVANTRLCNSTEFGFSVNIPQPAAVTSEIEGIPIGSQWRAVEKFTQIGKGYYKTRANTFTTESSSLAVNGPYGRKYVPKPVGYLSGYTFKNKRPEIQVISASTAFYALMRKNYELFSSEYIAEVWNRFLRSYGPNASRGGGVVLFIDLNDLPSKILWDYKDNFLSESDNSTDWERVTGDFDPDVYNTYAPCELPVTKRILKNPQVPKMFFKLLYRKIDNTSTEWREVYEKPFCVTNPNESELYANLRVKHPGSDADAYEYKFVPLLPDQTSYALKEQFIDERYGVFATKNNAKNRVPVLYPNSNQEFNFTANDGFKIMWKGFYDAVTSEAKLDDQATEYGVGIRYVNEGIEGGVDYPYMGMGVLTMRGGKGISGLGQLMTYYDNGAEITKVDQTTGTSNLFPDLCYHLLTYYPGSSGSLTNSQIDLTSFGDANTYTGSRNLFYDGVITERVGAHEFISEHAKFFLHRFGVRNGVYTLFPALIDSQAKVSAAPASQTVTLDNIVPGSLTFDYATLTERGDANVTIVWRRQNRYMPGTKETVTVGPATYQGPDRLNYDLSGFCTSKEHALTVARFLLAMRKQQDKTVTFTCFKSSVDLNPGRLFKFNLSITTSAGQTFTETDQYQVTSTTYREDGLLDIRAVRMPTGMSSDVFSATKYPEVS
jgi:hypothetical protein